MHVCNDRKYSSNVLLLNGNKSYILLCMGVCRNFSEASKYLSGGQHLKFMAMGLKKVLKTKNRITKSAYILICFKFLRSI